MYAIAFSVGTTTTIKLGQNLARNAATRILPSFAKSAAQRPKGFVYSPVAWPVERKSASSSCYLLFLVCLFDAFFFFTVVLFVTENKIEKDFKRATIP